MTHGEAGRERARRALRIVVVVNVVTLAIYLVGSSIRWPLTLSGQTAMHDFMAHYTAGKLAVTGDVARLYDLDAQEAIQRALGAPTLDVYLSPPLVAYLYAPFALMPYPAAVIAWTLVSVALFVLAARRVTVLAPSLSPARREMFFLVALASSPLYRVVVAGQDSALSLWIWAVGVSLALGGRDVASGLVFSLGLFKPQLFTFPPLLFAILGRKRALAAWAASASMQVALTFALSGSSGLLAWRRLLSSDRYEGGIFQAYVWRMASIAPFTVSLAPPSAAHVAAIGGRVLSVALVVLVAYRLFRDRAATPASERHAWALASLATLLAAPHFLNYDLVLLAIPIVLLMDGSPALSKVSRTAIVAALFLDWTSTFREPAGAWPWPICVVAASWNTVPLIVLVLHEVARGMRGAGRATVHVS